MSDRNIPVTDFIRFLNATRHDSTCPACRVSPAMWDLCTSTWDGNPYGVQVGREFMEPLFQPFIAPNGGLGSSGFFKYGMYCTNCGHLEQIFGPVIQRWIERSGEEGAKDGA